MSQSAAVASAAAEYFALAYDPATRNFEDVFHEACLIQGLRDGRFASMTASEYRNVIYNRPSPASAGAPRDEAILSIVNVSPEMSAVTVRVRIGQTLFIDHLVFHEIGARWLITSKSYHAAQSFAQT